MHNIYNILNIFREWKRPVAAFQGTSQERVCAKTEVPQGSEGKSPVDFAAIAA